MASHRNGQGYVVKQVGGFAAGLLIGGLIGSAAMLLMAPQSGKRTRDQIQHEGAELRERVTDLVEDAIAQAGDKAHQVVARAQREARKLERRGQDLLDAEGDAVSQAVGAGKAAARGVAEV